MSGQELTKQFQEDISNLNKEELKALKLELGEASKTVTQKDLEAFTQRPNMSRKERRQKLRWLKKQLARHSVTKPEINTKPEDDLTTDQAENDIAKMRAWATRYGIIKRQIDDLTYGPRENHKRLYEQNS